MSVSFGDLWVCSTFLFSEVSTLLITSRILAALCEQITPPFSKLVSKDCAANKGGFGTEPFTVNSGCPGGTVPLA